MTVQIININQGNFNGAEFELVGDESGSVVAVNLSKPPFNVDFNGIIPDTIRVQDVQISEDPQVFIHGTAVIVTNETGDNIMIVTYDGIIPSSQSCFVQFLYNSVA